MVPFFFHIYSSILHLCSERILQDCFKIVGIVSVARSVFFFYSVSDSCDYFNKLPQTEWFKTTEIKKLMTPVLGD